MTDKLDRFEKDIEDNFENQKTVYNQSIMETLTLVAKDHLRSKKPITIRMSVQDIEAIKIKASKCGLPYQTYINMLIHQDAMKI